MTHVHLGFRRATLACGMHGASVQVDGRAAIMDDNGRLRFIASAPSCKSCLRALQQRETRP